MGFNDIMNGVFKPFGFEISRRIERSKKDKDDTSSNIKSFADPMEDDGSTIIGSGYGGSSAGYYSHVLDLDGVTTGGERDLIKKYRQAAAQPECDIAISDIMNGVIVADSKGSPVNLTLEKSDLPEKIKDMFLKEFDKILNLLNFNFMGHDIFRRWYIDGKLYYHIMVDSDNLKEGIQELRMVDPLKMQKVKELTKEKDPETGVEVSTITDEYYLYSDGMSSNTLEQGQGVKIDLNSVVYVPSGLLDDTGKVSISYLHKCIKLVNQLRIMEDSLVIYRLSRAPERRIFYIDVGNLPKGKSEEYVQGIMAKYRNKLVYDATTGEISDDRKTMSMLEDFWLPRREGGKGTEITTLPGGENLGQIDDILFFQKKLYRALNVPIGRLDVEGVYNIGRSTEIGRDEIKFQKFVNRLRKKFSILFIELLKTQCVLKGICTIEEWPEIRESINIDYIEDNYFAELKESEILRDRLELLGSIESSIGTYYSKKWVKTNILNQSEQDIELMEKEIRAENGEEPEPEEDDFGGGDFGGGDFGGGGIEPAFEPEPAGEPDLGGEPELEPEV